MKTERDENFPITRNQRNYKKRRGSSKGNKRKSAIFCFWFVQEGDMEMKSRALIFGALLFVLVGLGSGQPESTENQANCTYTILIETTCSKGAGTSDRVSLRFGDAKSNDILVPHLSAKRARQVDRKGTMALTDVLSKPFEACGIDQFQVIGSCVQSPICYLFLRHRGDDRWRPGLAQVLVPEMSQFSSKSFYFRRFLPQHVWHGSDACDTEVTPFGIKHVRKIFGGKYMLESRKYHAAGS